MNVCEKTILVNLYWEKLRKTYINGEVDYIQKLENPILVNAQFL